MLVTVMHVGIVGVRVAQRLVRMNVRMRLAGALPRRMPVPMMFVVHMRMLVLHR